MKAFNYFFVFVLACVTNAGNAQKLVKLWETPRQLITPESVFYYEKGQFLFVSNINGKPEEKDGNGFISIITPNGKIKELKWITGLNAPKGMGVLADHLFVTDIDEVVEINISEKKIVKKYLVDGSTFLNDIAIDKDGTIYVTDSRGDAVFKLEGDTFNKWLTFNDDYHRPNGITTDGTTLFLGVQDNVLKVNPKSGEIEKIITNIGGLVDGLKIAGNGDFIVTDWMGKTQWVHPGKEGVVLLNTTDEKINAADAEYIPETGVLLIPTFFDNRVVAYKIKW